MDEIIFQFRLCYNKCNYMPNYMHQLLLEGSRHIWTKKNCEKDILLAACNITVYVCVWNEINISWRNFTFFLGAYINDVRTHILISTPHRDLNFDSRKRFGTRDFAFWAYILGYGESKKSCLNSGRNRSAHTF